MSSKVDESRRTNFSDSPIPPERHRDFPRGRKVSSTGYGGEVLSGVILGLILGGFIAGITDMVALLFVGGILGAALGVISCELSNASFRVEHKDIPDYLGDGWGYRSSGANKYLVKNGKKMSPGYHYFTLEKTPFGQTVYGHSGAGVDPDKVTLRKRE